MPKGEAIPVEASNAALAAVLGLAERRVAAVRGEGRLPLTSGGRIDLAAILRAGWRATLAQRGAGEAPETSSEADCLRVMVPGAEAALREMGPGVVLAAAELGMRRAEAERLADLAGLIVAVSLAGQPEALGVEPPECPTPEAWRASVRWDALFAPDGRSRVKGALAAESAREAAAP